MQIKIGYDIEFDVLAPTPMLVMLFVHPDRERDLVKPEELIVEPALPVSTYTDVFGNKVGRITAPAGRLRLRSESVIYDDLVHDTHDPNARQHTIDELPPDVLQFLIGSRYCEVDRLLTTAWDLFGKTEPGWGRVKAICNWVHANIKFGYPFGRPTKTAWDTYYERTGVCRDFMHLAVTFCRCMNIPARYATGYLGDIGVPADPNPMDFSAFFEAYLSGRWWVFDSRFNVPRLGRIAIAKGRDATDVALTTSFGPTQLRNFKVVTDEVKGQG
jgi:transglutaminase-like putative cysteine protease